MQQDSHCSRLSETFYHKMCTVVQDMIYYIWGLEMSKVI